MALPLEQPKVSKVKPAPRVNEGGLWSKFLTAFCPQIPRDVKRKHIGRNAACPCGAVNANSLEWRVVDGAMKQVPRPMKFKNCCSNTAIAARRYKATRANPIISQRMQKTLDSKRSIATD